MSEISIPAPRQASQSEVLPQSPSVGPELIAEAGNNNPADIFAVPSTEQAKPVENSFAKRAREIDEFHKPRIEAAWARLKNEQGKNNGVVSKLFSLLNISKPVTDKDGPKPGKYWH